MELNCLVPLASTNIGILSNVDPFRVTAIKTNPQGYKEDFCMRCFVKPTPFQEISFDRDNLQVI